MCEQLMKKKEDLDSKPSREEYKEGFGGRREKGEIM